MTFTIYYISQFVENYALASGSDSFKTNARTILDSRILEVEKLKLTTPTVAPPPLLDIDNDSESPFYDEEDWQDYPLFFTDDEKEAISVRIQRARKAATEEMIMSGHRYKTVYKTPYFITRPGGAQVIVPINQQVDAKIPYQVQQHATSVNQLNAAATDPRLNQRPLSSAFSNIQIGQQGSHTEMNRPLDKTGQGSMSSVLTGGPRDPRFQNILQEERVSSFTPNIQQEKYQARIQGQTPVPATGRTKDRTNSSSTMSDEHSSDQVSPQSLAHVVLQNPGPHHTDTKASLGVAEESVYSTPPGSSSNNKNSVTSQAPSSIPSVGIAYAQPQGINRNMTVSLATNLPEHPRYVKLFDPQKTVTAGGTYDRDPDARFFEEGRESDRLPQDPRLKAKTLEGPIVPEAQSSHTVELKKLMTKLGVNFVSNPSTESIVKNHSANLTAVDSGAEFSPSANSLTIGNYLNRIRLSSEIKEAIKSNEIENELYAKTEDVLPTFDKPQDPRRKLLLPPASDSSVSSNANYEASVSSDVAAGQNIDTPTVSQSSDVFVPLPKSDTAPLVSSLMAVDPTNTLPKCDLDGLSGNATTVTTSDSQSLNTSAVKDPGPSLSSETLASTASVKRKDQETSYFGLPSGSDLEACQSADAIQHDGKLERAAGSRFSTNHFWKQSGSSFRVDQNKTTSSVTTSNESMKNVPCSRASESLKQKDKRSANINSATDSQMPNASKALLAPAAVSTNSEHQIDKYFSSKQAVPKSITSAKSDLALTIPGGGTAIPPRSTYSSRSDNHGIIPSIATKPIPPLMGAQCYPVASYIQPTGRVESSLERYRTLEQQRIAEQQIIAEQQRVLEQQRIVDQQRIAQQQAIAFAQQLAMRQPQAMAIQHVLAQQHIVQQQAMAFRASQAAKSQAYQAYKPLTPPPQPPALVQSLFSMLNKTAIDPMLMPPADESNLISLDQTVSGSRHSFSRYQDSVNKASTYKRNGNKGQRKRDQSYASGTISKGSSPVSISKPERETCNKSKKIRESKIKSDARDNSFGRRKTESLKSSSTGLTDENIDDADEDICDSPVSLIAEDDWSDRSVDLENNDLDQNIDPKDQSESSSNQSIGSKLCDQAEDERSMDELLARYKELKQQLSIECDVDMSESLCSDVDVTTKQGTNQDTKTSAICSEHNEDNSNDAQMDRSGTSSQEESESEVACHEHESATSLLASNEQQPFTEVGNDAHTDHLSLAGIEGPDVTPIRKEEATSQALDKNHERDENVSFENVSPVSKEETASEPFDKNQERDENVSFENVSPVSKEETASEPFDKNQERDENVSFENVSPVSKEETASEPFDKNHERDENVSFENVSPVSKEETASEPFDKNQERDENVSFENVSPVSKEETASEPFDKNHERDENVSFENVSPVSKEETASEPFDKNQERDKNVSFENVSPVSKEETASEPFDKDEERDENVSFENVSPVSKEETASEPLDKNHERDENVSFENVSPVSKEETASEPFDKDEERDENISFENVSPVSKEETASEPFDKDEERDENVSFQNVSPVSKEETASEPPDKNQERDENVSFENVSLALSEKTASQPFEKSLEANDNASFENVSPVSKKETASEPFDKSRERDDENFYFENISPVRKAETSSQPFEKSLEANDNASFENVSPVSKKETASEPFDKSRERDDENFYFENISPVRKAEASSQPFKKSIEANDNVSFENVSPVSEKKTASEPFDKSRERDDENFYFENISPVRKAETSSQPFKKSIEANDNVSFENVSPVSEKKTASEPFNKSRERDDENFYFENISPVRKAETSSQPIEKSIKANDNVSFENVSPVSEKKTASEPFNKSRERDDENGYFENISPVRKAETSSQPIENSIEANDHVSFENLSPITNKETASEPFNTNEERDDSVPVECISPFSKEEIASQPFDEPLEQDDNAPFEGMCSVGKEETSSQSPESNQDLNDNADQEVADLLKNDRSAGDTSPEQADTPVSIFLESEDDDIGLACKEFVKSIMNDEKETERLTKDSPETEESAVIGNADTDMLNRTDETHSKEKPTKRRIFYGGLDVRQTEDIAGELVTSPLDGKEELCITIAADKQSNAIDCDSNDPKVSVNKAEGHVDMEPSQEEDLRAKLNKLRMEKRKGKRLQSVISEPREQVEGERVDYNPVAEKTEDANESYVKGRESRKQESHVTTGALTTKNDCNVDDKKPGEGRKLRSSTRNDVICSKKSEDGSPTKSPRKGPEGKMKDVVTRSLRSSAKNRRDSPEERGRYKNQNRNENSPSSSRSPSGHRRGRSRKSEGSRDRAYRRTSHSRIRGSRSRRRSYSRERSYSRGRCSRSRRLSPSRKRRSRSRGRRSCSTDRRSRRKGSRSPDSFGRDISRRTRAGLKRDKKAIEPSVNANLCGEESSLLSKDAVKSTKRAREDDGVKAVCESEAPCEKGIQRETDEGKRVGREGGETDKNGDNLTKQGAKETEGHSDMKGLVAMPMLTNMTVTDNSNGNPPQSDDKPKESSSTLNWYDEAEKMKYNVSTETRDCDANGNSKQLINDKALSVSGLIPVAIGATKAALVEFANANSQTSMNVNDLSRHKTSGLQPYLPCKDFDDQMFDEVYSIDKTLGNTNVKDTVLTAVNESVQSFDPPPAKKSKLEADSPCASTNVTGNEIMEEVLQGVAALDKDLVLLEAKEQGKVDVIAVCDMDLSEEDSQPGSTEDSAARRESFDSEQGCQDNEKREFHIFYRKGL